MTIEQVITDFQEDFILEEVNNDKMSYENRDSLFDGFVGHGEEKIGSQSNRSSNPFL